MPENFRLKTSEELGQQVDQVSQELEKEIAQPSKKEDIFKVSIKEIKEKFPVRYEAYLRILRKNKQQDGELSETEKKEVSERLGVLNNLDQYIENHWTNGEKTLRERQITVFEDMRDFLEEGGRGGYIKLPTGAGKTVIFSEFIEATGLRTLIVVPTKILVEQTEEKLSEFTEDLNVGKIYSEAKRQGTDVTIITYQSLVKKLNDGAIKPDDYKCLILDEAHVSLSDDRVDAVKKFGHAIRLGFTATPQYSWNKKVEQILPTEIHSLGVKEAAEEGIISSFSVILVETDVDITNVKVTSTGEYSQEDLQRVINVEGRNNSAVELCKQMFGGQLCVVYCGGIEHAIELSKIFNKKGISAEVISGKNSSEEQQVILKKFKDGEIKVLCNADILIAGFDEQKASVCLNLRPTLSSVMAEQRGGRVLRLDNSNPLKHATIVDFIDKNKNNRSHQITFAEIANASVVYSIPTFNPSFIPQQFNERDTRIVPDIKIEGLKVISDPMEVMRVLNKMQGMEIQLAKEGWIKPSELGDKFNISNNTVKVFAESFRKNYPGWFSKFKDLNGAIAEYYSSELIKKINEEFELREFAPEGWMVKNEAKILFKKTTAAIKKVVEKYRKSNPEWFHEYLCDNGVLREHYSPELVAAINVEFNSQNLAPKDWLTMNQFSQTIGRHETTVKRLTKKFRIDHPEWFRWCVDRLGRSFEFYSPELVRKIKESIKSNEHAPEGWFTKNGLANKTKKSPGQISRLAERSRNSNPEWFHQYLDSGNRLKEHYSPELIKQITKDLK